MPPKRKRTSDETNRNTNNPNNRKHFAYLKPRVRQVPQRTITSKWTTLPEPAQGRVRDIFRVVERPVIVRQNNERKRIEAQTAVQTFVKNLGKRLPRMVFPPATKESSFEFEAGLGEHRSLETYIATLTDNIDLLNTSIEKEEALLERERKELQELEKNAKSAKVEKDRQMKNEHPVLRHLDDLSESQDGDAAGFTISGTKDEAVTFSELENDPEVAGLLRQLNGHLNSMESNTDPLAGLQEAINRSQTALSLYPMAEDHPGSG